MKHSIPKIVHDFRLAMQTERATFFLVYSDTKHIKVTSNATQEIIAPIVTSMFEPTEAALELLASALPQPGWLGRLVGRKDRKVKARALLEKIRKMFILSTMETQAVPLVKPRIIV
jgi:hypothetical protein